MIVDKTYCASSFLMYRTIADSERTFAEGVVPFIAEVPQNRTPIHTSAELQDALRQKVETACRNKKAALCLSGGIDSAILAKFMSKGSVAYTFKCIVPGTAVTDESPQAARYAAECALDHRVIEIYWEDFERYAPVLMKHKGAPIHSIEVQIYKAALQAKKDGFDTLIFGESSDVLYGGMSGLLSKDWTFGEFVDRYSYVKPYYALKDSIMILEPYATYTNIQGGVSTHDFISHFFYKEGLNSYINACETAGMDLLAPFSETILAESLDLPRIRRGENKYLVREVFSRLYPGFEIPAKTPMPRPMNEWLKDWQGPARSEFWPHCTDTMTGDKKWLVWALEKFLDIFFPASPLSHCTPPLLPSPQSFRKPPRSQ